MEDILLADTPEVRSVIEAYLHLPPTQVALKLHTQYPSNIIQVIVGQIKALQKAQTKLPTWYHARCILPHEALEQATSEDAAALKNTYSGTTCLDLTAGLGVDAYNFAKYFDNVIAVEKQEILAEISNKNFQKLGNIGKKVTFMCGDSILLLKQLILIHNPDLIYFDPARRNDGQRLANPTTWIPAPQDVLNIIQAHQTHKPTILFKASPLFDLRAALIDFPRATKLTCLSIEGECKEMLIEHKHNATAQETIIEAKFQYHKQQYSFAVLASERRKSGNIKQSGSFLYVPDIAIYLTDLFINYQEAHLPQAGYTGYGGYYVADDYVADFAGQVYAIIATIPYANLRSYLRTVKKKQFWVSKKAFPKSTHQIMKEFSIQEGGTDTLLFTRTDADQWLVYHAQAMRR